MADDCAEWLAVTKRALDASDALINQHFRQSGAVENKLADDEEPPVVPGETFDPVTIADRGAEEQIRAVIEATFPEHGIIGEEFGAKAAVGDSAD